MFQPEEIVRDNYGFWIHSVLKPLDEGDRIEDLPEAEGMEFSYIAFEDDASPEIQQMYEDGCNMSKPNISWTDAIKAWHPEENLGDGWFLIAIYDTEDGPYSAFARQAWLQV